MLAMAPPAFENDPLLSRDVRAALSALSQHSEPWDGPAALIFSDGQVVGAKLDRNGLRPLRYTVTHDGLVVAGSETGLVGFEESRIAERQRLGPGEMIVANPATGTLFRWREIFKRLATQQSPRAGPPTPRPVHREPFSFPSKLGVPGARRAVAQLTTPLSGGARPGLFLLSDRGVDGEHAVVPALLATAAFWKRMVEDGYADVPLIVETAQAFDTHHVALLLAAGATAVVPYLAEQFAEAQEVGGMMKVRTAITAGLRKVLARMGVSTLASYRNSCLFEIVGLSEQFVSDFFEDAADFAGQKSLDDLLGDYLKMHERAFVAPAEEMGDAGLYRFRNGAELHANSPEVVRRLHAHVKAPDAKKYSAFEELADAQGPVFLRDLLETVVSDPIPLQEVEPLESIVRRFSTQAMSLGSLSPEAHKTLALAMNQLGGRSNTGEGGEDPKLYEEEPEAANKIKQVASWRFGVTANYLVHAQELEIKMAQGSKPGEGGQLPAKKVTEYIARIRHATPGTPLISPPPHHDIYSIEDLAQLIHDLRAVNPHARIGVKLVSGAGVGIIAAGVAKA